MNELIGLFLFGSGTAVLTHKCLGELLFACFQLQELARGEHLGEFVDAKLV